VLDGICACLVHREDERLLQGLSDRLIIEPASQRGSKLGELVRTGWETTVVPRFPDRP